MPAQLHKTIADLRDSLGDARRTSAPIILVPTMGALHPGHQALFKHAITLANQPAIGQTLPPRIVVSIFVNPLQFGPGDDFSRYPRNLSHDAELATAAGVTDIFAPSAAEFSPPDISTAVDPGPLAHSLCGPFRPGHFRGVCTIVLKLFNVIQSTHAIFGWKDAQQFIILRKMVRDLNLPITMIGVETVREPDGLAMSSRNAYLTPDQRRAAPALHRTLLETKDALLCGAIVPPDIEPFAHERLKTAGITQVDYVQLVSQDNLAPPTADGPWLLAAAVHLGSTRIIDNLRFALK